MFISIEDLRQLSKAKRYEEIKALFLTENTKISLPNSSYKQFYDLVHDKTPESRFVCFAIFENTAAREVPSKEPEYVFNIILEKRTVTYETIANIIKNSIECGMRCYLSTASLRTPYRRLAINAFASSVIIIDLDSHHAKAFEGLSKEETEQKLLHLGAPTPTYLYHTGRGYNAAYKLDEMMNLSQKDVVERRLCIIKNLLNAWKAADADSHCTDVTRLTRMQSSINVKSGVAADIVHFAGEGKVWTLDELETAAAVFAGQDDTEQVKTEKVKIEKTEIKREATKSSDKMPVNTVWIWEDIIVANKETLFTRRLREKLSDLETLLRLRNGDMTSCRNYFLHFIACFARYLDVPTTETTAYLKRVAAVMTTRDKDDDVSMDINRIVQSAYSGTRRNYGNARIILELGNAQNFFNKEKFCAFFFLHDLTKKSFFIY